MQIILNNEKDAPFLEIRDNQTWIRLIVRLKDNSGINVTGTREEKRELLKQKDQWFKPVIDEFLSTLDDEKFEFKGRSSQEIVVMTTKEGFDNLINDSRINKIHMDAIGHAIFNENKMDKLWISILIGVVLIILILYLVHLKYLKKK